MQSALTARTCLTRLPSCAGSGGSLGACSSLAWHAGLRAPPSRGGVRSVGECLLRASVFCDRVCTGGGSGRHGGLSRPRGAGGGAPGRSGLLSSWKRGPSRFPFPAVRIQPQTIALYFPPFPLWKEPLYVFFHYIHFHDLFHFHLLPGITFHFPLPF